MPRYRQTDIPGIDTVLSNFYELDRRSAITAEERTALMHELLTTASANSDADETLRRLRRVRRDSSEAAGAFTEERISLFREYLEKFPEAEPYAAEQYFGSSEALPENAVGKTEYVSNGYTSEAFSRFSDACGGLSPVIARNFETLCEDVGNGVCEYGIIPVENSDNGKLLHFYSLINRFDLKIASVFRLDTPDNDGSTMFALVKRKIEFSAERDRLEFLIPMTDASQLSIIIGAAEISGLSLLKIDSFPLSYRDNEYYFCPVFKITNNGAQTFLTFMTVDFPRFTPVGIYCDITNKKTSERQVHL